MKHLLTHTRNRKTFLYAKTFHYIHFILTEKDHKNEPHQDEDFLCCFFFFVSCGLNHIRNCWVLDCMREKKRKEKVVWEKILGKTHVFPSYKASEIMK